MRIQDILVFLLDLQENNNRDWFLSQKDRYDALREDFAKGVDEIINSIALFDPDIRGLSAKECIYRINRDIRFSKDKTPYKDHFGAYIAKGGRKSERAGYYLHLQPGNSLVACGLWCPEPQSLKLVRSEISLHAHEFLPIVEAPENKKLFGELWGEKLRSVPKGFSKEDPAAEWLKYKSFMFEKVINDDEITADSFSNQNYLDLFEKSYPLVQFLNRAFE